MIYVYLIHNLELVRVIKLGWNPFGHCLIGHELLIVLEKWKASRHRSLWLVVSNWVISKWDAPIKLLC